MRIHIITILFAILTLLVGCNQFSYMDNLDDTDNEVQHTLILYLLANNTLAGYIDDDLREVLAVVDNNFSSKARIVVYYDRYEQRDKTDSTTLFLVQRNNIASDEYLNRLTELKKYPDQDSTDPTVMQNVLNDIKELVPSKTYGIVISGHGTGWFPQPTNDPATNTTVDYQRSLALANASMSVESEHPFVKLDGANETRWYGHDNYYEFDLSRNRYARTKKETYMSSTDLAAGLSPIKFEYIIFDACFMSSIEMLYDLRNSAKYIVASPTEILANGFPYTNVINGIFNKGMSLYDVAHTYIEFYLGSATQSAAITIIDCSQIDALAEKARAIYRNGTNDIDISQIQPLEGITANHVFFDMNQYIKALCSDEVLYAEYLEQFNRTVPYHDNTGYIYSAYGTTPILGDKLTMCGISAYIPRESLPITKSYYQKTAWYDFISH